MTRRRTFIGFLAGTSATIALKAGGQTVQASVDDWGENRGENGAETVPQGSVTITPYRNSGTAPAGNIYEVEATGQTGRSYQDVYYLWTFSEGLTFDNLPSDFPWATDNVTTSYGPVVSWVHKSPGAHTVRCDAWDILNGNYLGFDEVTFTANDLSEFTQVICIGTDSANMPMGALGPYADFGAALANHNGNKVQYLFERGVDHTGATNVRIRTFDAQHVYFGTYGPSATAPTMRLTWFNEQIGEIIVDGVNFAGDFDPASPETNTSLGSDLQLSSSSTFTTIWSSDISGFRKVNAAGRMVFGNTIVRDWCDYGISVNVGNNGVQGWIGFVGCDVSQADGAVLPPDSAKYSTATPFFPVHGPFRLSGPEAPVCFDMCRLASNNSWGDNPHPQPTIRWGESPSPNVDMKLNVSRVVGEGSALMTQPAAGNAGAGADAAPQQVVIDKVHFTQLWGGNAGTNQRHALHIVYAGQTVRNYIGVIPDIPNSTAHTDHLGAEQHVRIGSNHPISTTQAGADDGNYNILGNENGPFELYGYTLLDQRSTANLYGRSFEAIYKPKEIPNNADIRIANGYHWSRDAVGADYRASSVTLVSEASWTPHITQTRKATDRLVPPTILTDTAHRTTVEAAQAWAPPAPTGVDTTSDTVDLVGDPLTVTSHALLPLDDFFGNARTGTYKGAIDPASTGPLDAP